MLAAGSWLQTVVYEPFLDISNGISENPKYQMWSGHDSNIAAALITLGAFEPHDPAFASTLYFELRNGTESLYLNIFYKDDDLGVFEPITVKGCTFDCPLNQFGTILSEYLIDTDTWETECQASNTSSTNMNEILSNEEVSETLRYIQYVIHEKKEQEPYKRIF